MKILKTFTNFPQARALSINTDYLNSDTYF